MGAWNHWHDRPVVHAPGVLVAHDPVQRPLDVKPAGLGKLGYQITPWNPSRSKRVCWRSRRYRFDRAADLSPVDLAARLGPDVRPGGPQNESTSARAEGSISGMSRSVPIPRREIEVHSANMHMIPATGQIERRLVNLRPGQVVALAGYLVEVHAADGWQWRSSLTREDTGAGACELVWVETLDVR